jgi:hypothetical protein
MFDPSERFCSDPFARYQAAMRVSEEHAVRAQAEGQTMAQRQQRIQNAAAKQAALARPNPPYKPQFS